MPAKQPGLIKLSPEARTRMQAMESDLATLDAAVISLKKLNVDTTQMEDRLKSMKDLRKVLLEEFG